MKKSTFKSYKRLNLKLLQYYSSQYFKNTILSKRRGKKMKNILCSQIKTDIVKITIKPKHYTDFS